MTREILIIEDEPSIADNIAYALRTDGFEPVWCSTGTEGLERLRDTSPALVMLDIGLPDQSGFEVLKTIRTESEIPVIVLTARSEEIDRVLGLELGADDYVSKPFSPRELAARVKAVLRRYDATGNVESTPDPNITAASLFRIEHDKLRIFYQKELLSLSRYEYRLLRFLIENRGRVFTRDQLMDRVWDEPEMSLARTVDTHIKTLRKKLKAIDSEKDPIVTHRGTGYSLEESKEE